MLEKRLSENWRVSREEWNSVNTLEITHILRAYVPP